MRSTIALTVGRAPEDEALPEQVVASADTALLAPLEVTLGRALVIHVDVDVSDGFTDSFQRLDAHTGAFDRQASPRTLMDVDVYVMVRDDWDVFRNIEGHDLGTAIRQRARDVTSGSDISYFQTQLTAQSGPGTSWRDCKTHGWTSMADIPAQC